MNDGLTVQARTSPIVSFTIPDPELINTAVLDPRCQGQVVTKVGLVRQSRPWGTCREGGSPELLILLVTAGTGACGIDGAGEFLIGPGTVVVVPPGVAHSYRFSAPGESEALGVQIAGPGTDVIIAGLREKRVIPKSVTCNQGTVRKWVEMAIDTLRSDLSAECLVAVSCSIPILCHVICLGSPAGRNSHGHGYSIVQQSLKTLQGGTSLPTTDKRSAATAGISGAHLATLFRRLTGAPPLRYLHTLQMHRACALLETTDLSVKEIAAAVGYQDYRYFDRMFRRVVRQTPGQYRLVNCGWSGKCGA